MKNTRDLFRENLRAIITTRGLKLDKAAELCEISLSLLNQILSGKTAYSPETIDQICKGLNCTQAELFFAESKEPTKREELTSLIRKLPDVHVDTLITLSKGLIGQAPVNKKESGS